MLTCKLISVSLWIQRFRNFGWRRKWPEDQSTSSSVSAFSAHFEIYRDTCEGGCALGWGF